MKLTPWEIQDKILTMRKANEVLGRKTKSPLNHPVATAKFDREAEAIRVMNKARNRAKLTQAEIAAKMGTTQSAVSRMEKGRVTYTTLCKYVEACGGKLKIKVIL